MPQITFLASSSISHKPGRIANSVPPMPLSQKEILVGHRSGCGWAVAAPLVVESVCAAHRRHLRTIYHRKSHMPKNPNAFLTSTRLKKLPHMQMASCINL